MTQTANDMPATDPPLLHLLRTLERDLLSLAVRHDPARLDALLHEDFREIGRSGACYDKADIIAQPPDRARQTTVVADRFALKRLGDAAALLSYRSAHQRADGARDRFALRSSIWLLTGQQWQVVFHQGTPTLPFDPDPAGPLAGGI